MSDKNQRNILDSEFEPFELDDGFLLAIDSDTSKHQISTKDGNSAKKLNRITVNKSDVIFKVDKVDDTKKHFEDLSIFLEDLNESDFFEKSISKNKKEIAKVTKTMQNNDEKAEELNNKVTCSSPVLLPKSKNKLNRTFSSTPLKPSTNTNPEEKGKAKKTDENFEEISDGFLESDIFDDWDTEKNSQEDSITLSQALKLLEEAKSAMQSKQKEDLNVSVDLLTGRPVGGDVEDLFAESFNLTNFVENKQEKESSDDFIIDSEDSNSGSKFPAVQKVNFKTETKTETEEKKNNIANDFNSDDDFDFLTQELLKKPKHKKTLTQLKSFDSDDSSESIKRRGKYCRIIESDSADDIPDFKFNKRCKKKKIRTVKNCKKNAGREFIESEVEVSELTGISSDESEEEGSYDASFLDEELYLTQNCSANMTAKYLESVKSPNRPGAFKIPQKKPYCSAYVFSQIPDDNSAEYELDSFCVNEVEEEVKTDLSDLEIAEKILEMDRKKKKRNRFFKNQGK